MDETNVNCDLCKIVWVTWCWS